MKLKIDNTIVSENKPPFIIAEAGSNFNQDKNTALNMIKIAADCGASAIKFQLFNAEKLYPKTNKNYKVFKSIELNPLWLKELSDYAKYKKIIFLASAFDYDSVDSLEKINIESYKIASSEVTNLKLINYISSKKKPIILSTGMSDLIDVQEAISIIELHQTQYALLQCTSLYPCPIKSSNLLTIPEYIKKFNCVVGYSDHTLENTSALVAVGLGSCIFEKHFTLNKKSKGPDHFYSLEPKELKKYIDEIKSAYQAKGNKNKIFLDKEKIIARREGIYARNNIKKGQTISSKDILLIRPAIGIGARYFNYVINMKSKIEIKKDQPISWKDLKSDI